MSTQDAINRMSIQATTVGVDEATAKLNQLAAAQGGVAVASQSSERATLSLDRTFSNLERRFNTAIRNQQDYEKIQKQLNLAVQQNPALQERANQVMAAAADRYGQVTGAQKAFGLATSTLNLQVAAFASGLGITGQILSAFGPAGFAAAVALGAVQSALSLASQKSHELAEKSKEIFEFAEATGLTTRQFQALRSEAGKFGVDADTLATGLAKFSVGFEELRNGSGNLFTAINRINPAITEQMKTTTDAASAFTLYGKAVAATDDIFKRNALLKAGLGRGGATFGGFLSSSPDVIELGKAAEAAGRGIDENLIAKLRQLEIDINKTKSAANTVFATMFGTSTLQAELDFQKGLLVIAQSLSTMTMSSDLKKFIDVLSNPATQGLFVGLISGAVLGGGVGAFAAGVGVVPGAIAGAAIGGGAGFMAGAIKSSVTDIGATSGTSTLPIPAAPNFDQTFKALEKQKVEDAKKSVQLLATEAKNLVSVLGSAASPTEKLNASILELTSRAKDAGISAEALERGITGLKLDAAIAQQNAHNSALGASASVTDTVAAKTLQLAKAQQEGAALTPKQIQDQISLAREQALGTAQIKSQIDSVNVQAATVGMSAGAAAEYTAKQTLLNDAIRNHKDLTDADKAAIDEQAKALGRATQAAAEKNLNATIKFDGDTAFLSDADKQIASILRQTKADGWKNFMDGPQASAMRFNAALSDINGSLRDVGKSMFSAFLSGKSGADAMVQSLDNMAKKLADSAFDNLTSLDPGRMGTGVVQAGASALISLFTGDQKAKKQQEEDIKAWNAAKQQANILASTLSGGDQGSLTTALRNARNETLAYKIQAEKAGDLQAAAKLEKSYSDFVERSAHQFQRAFAGVIAGLNEGLGPDSGFAKAAADVRQIGDSLLGFINDTTTAMANNISGAAIEGDDLYKTGSESYVAQARSAAQNYLVSLLGTAPVLSATEQALDHLHGTAAQLTTTLVDLGMSSTDAARAIDEGVKRAMTDLAKTFTDGLTSRLNIADGKSYLNDATALLIQHQQDLADAASLGVDPAVVAALFKAEAQKIINDAGLVGDSFTEFTKLFPQLASVVTESSDAVTAAVKKQQDALNASAKSILDYVNGLSAGSQSTLSPTDRLAAAQAQYNAKLVLAQSGNADAQSSIATDAENLRTAARDMYGSTSAYQSIFEGIKNQLLALPAVTATTDPVLQAMRDVLLAVQATTSAVSTMQASLIGALAANSPALIAGAFLTSGAVGLTFDQFKAGFPAGLASDSTLHTLYQAIDTNRDGIISQLELLQAALKPAIDSGNAASIAAALSSYFNAIDANTSQSIDFNEMRAALGGMASDSALRAMFTTLDLDNSGSIDRLELIRASSQTTSSITQSMAQFLQTANNLQSNANSLSNYANDIGNYQSGILSAIQNLQSTASQQLVLLTTQYGSAPANIGISKYDANSRSVYTQTFTANNTVMAALNKIVLNTFATANNTWAIGQSGYKGWDYYLGTYATGGLISGPGTATSDSVAIRASNGEYMIREAMVRQFGVPFFDALNAGIMPAMPTLPAPVAARNDNARPAANDDGKYFAAIDRTNAAGFSALIAEVRELREAVYGGAKMQIDAIKQSPSKRPGSRTGTDG